MSKEENVFVGTNCQSFDPSKVQCDKEGNMPIHILDKYCEENEQKELFQYLRRTNQVNKSESKIENDSHEVEKGIEDWEDDLEDQTNNVPNRKSTLILPQSVLILIMLMRKLIKNNEKSNQNGITR